jgi:WD40 repeat protein/energy-coupling factor transporter ATP-binding protein EcfA2
VTRETAADLKNPYPGLRPFEPEDAGYFFGRDRQVDELLLRLRDHRFVAVLGLSGSGKSSLVRAGLIPALKAGHLTSSGSHWRVALFRPGSRPLEALAAALDEALGARVDRLARLGASTQALLLDTREGREADESLLVVVDQFEEIFRVPDASQAARFIDLLLAVEQDLSPLFRVYVTLTMRTDRLGESARFDGLPEALNRSQYLVPKLASDQLREAIEGPAALTETDIAPELVQQLAIEASEGRDQLPLLQHLLMTLWEGRETRDDSSAISYAAYEAIGSAAAALNAHADRVLAELPAGRQALASFIFRALTEAGEGRDQRRPQRLSQLAAITGAPLEEVRGVAEHFLTANFLTSPDRWRTDDWEADITHESLIRQWKQLAGWVAEEAKGAEDYRYFYRGASRGAVPLTSFDLDLAIKWLDKRLNAAWAARYGGDFDATVRYIRRSEQAKKEFEEAVAAYAAEEAARKDRARRNAYILAGACLVVAVVIGALAIFAWRASIRANQERHNAQAALARSAVQDGIKFFDDYRPDEAAGYFARALRSAPDSMAAVSWISDLLENTGWWFPSISLQHRGPVFSAAFSLDGRQVVTASGNTARVWEATTGRPVGEPLQHLTWVNFAAFSPDGRRLVTASGNAAHVWEFGTGAPVGAPMQHQAVVLSAAFSPNGRHVVTASEDNTAQVWEADSGKPVGAPMQHQRRVNSAAFSPDGGRVLTASWDNTARLWSAASGKPINAPLEHGEPVNSAAFSPDGRRVVTASRKTVRVWEADTGRLVGAPMQHQGDVRSATFSPDGRFLVTASEDDTARVWEAYTGRVVGAPLPHQNSVLSAAFSPDGRRVLTASLDDTARVWEADTGKPVSLRFEHQYWVNSAAYSSDGRRVVTASWDKTARVWEADTGKPVGPPMQHDGVVHSAAFSSDGRRVVTASEDHTARVWEADSGKPVGAPLQHQGNVRSAAFSPDGRRVVSASEDGTARMWEADTGKPVGAPLQHGGFVYSAAFSADGRRVVTASADQTARVWDAVSGKPVSASMEHRSIVLFAAFSPDGRHLVTASWDQTARVWEADTGKPVSPPMQHHGIVHSAAFSPDGHRVVTASNDNTARVWDADSGKPVGPPLQHQGSVYSAAFSPDGRRVVTASADGTARVWEAETGKPLGAPKRHRGSLNSAAFSPDGRHVVTTSSFDNTARVWNVLIDCCATSADADRLATLAEAVSGNEVSETGSLTVLEPGERLERLRKLGRSTGTRPAPTLSLDWLIRQFTTGK